MKNGTWEYQQPLLEADVKVLGGPFPLPTPEEIAGHAERLARIVKEIWDECGADPRWDRTHVDGAYWVRRKRHKKIELARFCEGMWATFDWSDEAKMWEIVRGAGEPPTVLFGPLDKPGGWNRISPFAQRLIDEGSELERERLFTEHSPGAHDVAAPKPKLH